MEEKQLVIRVFGKVQGVNYRQTTKEKAESLGLKGVVMNEVAGNVYIIARGNEENLALFLTYCKMGPPKAEVTNVIIEETDLTDFQGFKVIR